jgi:Ca2+-binding EF-hand superfamily protein
MRKVAHIKLSSEEAEAMIEFADSDEDGLVSFDDFLQVVTTAQGGDDANKDGADDSDES